MDSSSPVTGSTMTTFLLRIDGEVGLLSPENEGDVGRLLEDDSVKKYRKLVMKSKNVFEHVY